MKKEISFFIIILLVAIVSSGLTIFVLQQKQKGQFLPFPALDSREFSPDGIISESPDFVAPEENAATAVRVEITQEAITPKEFRVKQGEKVTLAAHGGDACQFLRAKEKWLISIITLMPSSEPNVFTTSFAAPPAGLYAFSCNVPGHSERNIKGTMIVE